MDQIYLKALKTFRGSNGYIAQGQEFYTTNQDEADRLVRQGYAYFTDESQNVNGAFVGQAAPAADSVENKKVYKTSELERNVSSLSKPVEIKVSVAGIKPEDVNVQVVNDQEAQAAETVYVDQSGAANAQRGGYQTQDQNRNYQTQNIQAQNQSTPQSAPQEFPDYYPDYYKNAINQTQGQGHAPQGVGQPQFQPQGQTEPLIYPHPEQDHLHQQEQELEKKEQELIRQLNELQQQQAQLKQELEKPHIMNEPQEEPVFEVRHVGGGWYDLPNGERVQGKENAQARLNDLYHSGQLQGQPQGQPQGQEFQARQVGQAQFPNPERVRQANAQPEDGAQLNALNEGLPVDAFSANRLTGSGGVQGSLSGGQSQSQGQGQSFQGVGFDQRGANAQFQARNSQGQFTDGGGRSSGGQAGATTGASGSGSGGNGGSGNSGGSARATGANTGNNTGGGNGSGNSGGANTSGNTGQ